MDNTGGLDNMKKITSQDNIFNLRSFILQMQPEEYFTKIEGHKYPTTSPFSELTIIYRRRKVYEKRR